MKSRSIVLLPLLGCLWLLAFLPALAQSPAARRSQVVSYRAIPGPEPEDQLLDQCVLFGDGTSRRELLRLPEKFELQASASSGPHNLFLLRKAFADTVQLVLTDSLGKVQRQPRQFMKYLGTWPFLRPQLLGLPGGQGFIMTYLSGTSKKPSLNVARLNPDLSVRWQQPVTAFTVIPQIAVSESHVWLRSAGAVWVLRLATGEVTGTGPLTPTEVTEAAVLVPAGLLLLGSTHRDYAPQPAEGFPEPEGRRRDIVRLITPEGQQALAQTLIWPGSRRPAFHWQTAGVRPDGSYELVGETYREVPDGTTLAMAVLGAGMMGINSFGLMPTSGYLNQRPAGLLLVHLSANGALTDVRALAIPEAMHISPADSSRTLPKGKAIDFRVRGLSANQQQVVLNTSRQVLLYSLADGRLRPLTPARHTTPTVLGIEAGFINVGWTLKPGESLPEVERLPLP